MKKMALVILLIFSNVEVFAINFGWAYNRSDLVSDFWQKPSVNTLKKIINKEEYLAEYVVVALISQNTSENVDVVPANVKQSILDYYLNTYGPKSKEDKLNFNKMVFAESILNSNIQAAYEYYSKSLALIKNSFSSEKSKQVSNLVCSALTNIGDTSSSGSELEINYEVYPERKDEIESVISMALSDPRTNTDVLNEQCVIAYTPEEESTFEMPLKDFLLKIYPDYQSVIDKKIRTVDLKSFDNSIGYFDEKKEYIFPEIKSKYDNEKVFDVTIKLGEFHFAGYPIKWKIIYDELNAEALLKQNKTQIQQQLDILSMSKTSKNKSVQVENLNKNLNFINSQLSSYANIWSLRCEYGYNDELCSLRKNMGL